MTTTRILAGLLFAAALTCSFLFAHDIRRAGTENGQQRVEFALHGKTTCALVDDKILCVPATMRTPIRLAFSASN